MRLLFSLVLLVSFWSLSGDAAPAPDEKVKKAIERGVKYLTSPNVAATYTTNADRMGRTAVVGLALLESGVSPKDPLMAKIIEAIRGAAFTDNRTYEAALCIMFLDRLGEKTDVPIIQYLAVRLMLGQTGSGTWGYTVGDGLGPVDTAKLRTPLNPELTNKPKNPKAVPTEVSPTDPEKKDSEGTEERVPLHPIVAKWIQQIQSARPRGGPQDGNIGGGDHSNTQFALIALWCARKHSVPVDGALARVDQHYRACQGQDGGWSYNTLLGEGPSSTPAMTCSGLLSLTVGYGIKKQDKEKEKKPLDPNKDPWMKKGLTFLGANLAEARNPRQGNPMGPPINMGLNSPATLHQNYYFLWSLERTGVILGLETIGNQDWYGWGRDQLLQSQTKDGGWAGGNYASATPDLDTAFALLFLNRANLAKDLTANLKGKVRDPGSVTLKGGKGLDELIDSPKDPEVSITDPKTKPKPKEEPKVVLNPSPEPKTSIKPPVDEAFDAEAQKLSDSLVKASASQRAEVLTKLRDSKGAVYTEALARSLVKLDGDLLQESRDALASRLSRMTANTLRELLKDDNREIRRAAALACAMKEDKNHIPDLITSLSDRDAMVIRASRAALKSLTGKDFGPDPSATEAEKAKAIAAWKELLK